MCHYSWEIQYLSCQSLHLKNQTNSVNSVYDTISNRYIISSLRQNNRTANWIHKHFTHIYISFVPHLTPLASHKYAIASKDSYLYKNKTKQNKNYQFKATIYQLLYCLLIGNKISWWYSFRMEIIRSICLHTFTQLINNLWF